MDIKIIKECGYEEAMLGLSLSYNIPEENTPIVASKLYDKEGGHNKFLESIQMWLDITAPRYWWQEMDTYRIGVTKQSESTMHTMMRKPLTQSMFAVELPASYIQYLEELRVNKDFHTLKALLPEGFLQRRVVSMNYKTLRNIVAQRKSHRLKEWKVFCEYVQENSMYEVFLQHLL